MDGLPPTDVLSGEHIDTLIDLAIDEDLGHAGDITSGLLADQDADVTAEIVVHEDGIICGLALLPRIVGRFAKRLGQSIELDQASDAKRHVCDGAAVRAQERIAAIQGKRRAVLAAERTILNFLGRMSGVATFTRWYVDAARLANPQVEVLDTRKTIPGWRELDKYAVQKGGGTNHRAGLHDAILIKDNHIEGIPLEHLADRLEKMLKNKPTGAKFVEVEVDTLDQLRAVLEVGCVDIVLLDNFTCDQLREAVRIRDEAFPSDIPRTPPPPGGPAAADGARRGGRVQLEASGNVILETITEIAATGVDRISVGALTHSAPALDLGLDVR